jgi:Ca-activated chloride channel family protein
MSTTPSFTPVAAPSRAPIRLAMQRLWLSGQLMPAGARLLVEHVFESGEDHPLEVIYSFPLPRDAALRRFRIAGDGFETESELKEREEAVQAYERGIAAGSLAALARQYGDGLVNLTVGNIRPGERVTVQLELLAGVELRDDGLRFRFPFTLAPGYHSQMRVAASGGEGEIELPATEFGDLILPPFREDAGGLHQVGFELAVFHQLPIEEIASPSHSIRVRQAASGPARVALARERDVPNRDLVLDLRFQPGEAQVLAGPAGDGKRSFAVVAPSTLFGRNPQAARRVAILLDRSGSMQGAPIMQARKAIGACLAALGEEDWFGLFAFDDQVESMQPALVAASRQHRESAGKFLKQVEARGGTNLVQGVREAAKALAGAGDILVITDGQVSGTEAILAEARALGVRLFCLGIGSASQDRFLTLLARETGGGSRFVTAGERVDLAAVDLFASTGRPLASGLKASGVEPEPPRSVFAGTPVLLLGEMDNTGRVDLCWNGGKLSFEIPPGDPATGETLRLLRGSRLITDWECRYPAAEALGPLANRRQSRVAGRLTELSRRFGLASREMCLVAVVKRQGDRAGQLPETRVVPVGMPQDTAFSAYFSSSPMPARARLALGAPLAKAREAMFEDSSALATSVPTRATLRMKAMRAGAMLPNLGGGDLLELATALEPDGGMPGKTDAVRAARTVAAILAFAGEGHTLTSGAFRLHVRRLVEYLKSLKPTDSEARLIEVALEAAATGKAREASWLALARDPATQWQQIEAVLAVSSRFSAVFNRLLGR